MNGPAFVRPASGVVKLSILTFFLFFGAGAAGPIWGLYLTRDLRFSGGQAGVILATSALGVAVAPFLGSIVADRYVSTERLLSVCFFGSALFVFLLSRVNGFWAVLVLFTGYGLMYGPMLTLNNAAIFHHMEERGGDYGRIRVFGTLGWIAVAWFFSWCWLRGGEGRVLPERLANALVLTAIVFAAMGLFSLTITPNAAFSRTDASGLLHREAFSVIREPPIRALTAAVFLCFLTDRFYFYGAAIFLQQSGFDESMILPALSLGQLLEIPAMTWLGAIISQLGIKQVMMLGLICNSFRYILFAFSAGRPELIMAGITFHGLTYAFFFAASFICLDRFVKPSNRAGVHLLFTIFTSGVGTLAGNLLAGFFAQYRASATGAVDFRGYWAACLVILAASFVALMFLREPDKKEAA